MFDILEPWGHHRPRPADPRLRAAAPGHGSLRRFRLGRTAAFGGALALAVLLASTAVSNAQSQSPAPIVQSPPPDSAPAPSATQPVAPSTSTGSTAGKLTVPANTRIPLELRSTINTRTAQPGQSVYCTTVYPVVVENRIILPVGTYVKGKVTEVKRPGRVKGKAELAVTFDEITLPNGVTKSLRNASLSGYGGSGNEGFNSKEGKIQGEGTKGKDAETVAVSGAEGAGIGSIAGISSHHSGLGAGVGGAGGALGGLVYVLASRGKEVVLPAGTTLEVTLAIPLTYDEDDLASPASDSSGPDLGRRDPGPGL